jgi:cell division protein FtsB
MNVVRLLLYLAVGYMVRSVVLFFFGTGGLVDFRALEAQEKALETNIQNLERINADLMEEQQALATDPQRLALLARELGYFREGDQVLELEGSVPAKRHFTVGTLVRVTHARRRADWIVKLLGLVVPVVVFAFRRRRRVHASFGH